MAETFETELSGSIVFLELEIAAVRQNGDFDALLDICESLLKLIERLDQQVGNPLNLER